MIEVKVCHFTNKPKALFGVSTVRVDKYTNSPKIVNLQYRNIALENIIYDGEDVIFDGENLQA